MYVATVAPSFDEDAWFGGVGIVYDSAVLLRTYAWLQHHQHMSIPDDVEPAINAVYERQLNPIEYLPFLTSADQRLDELRDRKIWHSTMQLLGEPNQPDELFDGRAILTSDDDNATHYLRPRTRDGDPSLSVVCVQVQSNSLTIHGVDISLATPPPFQQIKDVFMPALMRVSAKRLIWLIKQHCQMPQSWQRIASLRGVYVLLVNHDGTTNIPNVQYLDDLGLYIPAEPSTEDEL
jgi:hypothetical protein